MFWFFGYKVCRILAPGPGIEPLSSALEGKVLTTGPPGKSLNFKVMNFMSQEFYLNKKTSFFGLSVLDTDRLVIAYTSI